MVLLNPSGPGVSDEIARALRKDDELIDLKVSALRQQVTQKLLVYQIACLESGRYERLSHWSLASRYEDVNAVERRIDPWNR